MYSTGTTDLGRIERLYLTQIVSACALILVAWGVIVALAAYISATGAPLLRFEIKLAYARPNELVFEAVAEFPGRQSRQRIKPPEQPFGAITVINGSRYSARNPGVRIEFNSFGLSSMTLNDGWSISSTNDLGVSAIQWDGGANYIIHGKWSRKLPSLDFGSLESSISDRESLTMTVSLAADGMTPVKTEIPLRVFGPADYDKYMQGRLAEAGPDDPVPPPSPDPS